jgi:hypothetical protein
MIGEPHEFEILPAAEMQRKYGMYAENCSPIHLDPFEVPTDLQDLIPWAERFGISCDITRHDLGYKTSQEDKDALSNAIRGRHARINDWLNDSLTLDGRSRELSEAEYRFLLMCVFELEENGGPGLAGAPEWYVEKQNQRHAQATRERFSRASNGPACPMCGKQLRTLKAQQCFACGWSARTQLG